MSTTIECPVCNNEYKQLTAQHIFKHNLTIAEFKEKFPLIYLGNPDAEISKQKVRETQYVIDNIRCKQCDIIITSHDRKRRVFCSHTCSATYNNKLKEKIKKTCVYCKAVFTNHDRKSKYCSNKCQ